MPSDYDIVAANHRPYMKHRKREFCKVDGCPKQWEVFNDLTRHLRTQHQLNREEYEKYVKYWPSFFLLSICCTILCLQVS